MKRSAVVVWVALSLLGWLAPAHAHLMSTGFGPFYDGMTHLILSPDDLLARSEKTM